jgi:hypothetical protein
MLLKWQANATGCTNLASCILDHEADGLIGRAQSSGFGNRYLQGQVA